MWLLKLSAQPAVTWLRGVLAGEGLEQVSVCVCVHGIWGEVYLHSSMAMGIMVGRHLSELVGCVPTDLFSVPLQVGNGYSDEAALILHRKGFDCRFPSRNTGLFCSTTQGKVSAVKVSPW